MERVTFWCLLLFFSRSGAEHQDIVKTEQKRAVPERVTAAEQTQGLESDVQAVLRDMSATLAKHEMRIELLQTLLREQAAKLRELEQQSVEVQALKLQQQAQAGEVDALKEQQQAQASDLTSVTSRTDVTEKHVESLRRDRAVGQVAFSASLLASGSATVGPFNTHTTLVFKYIFSNIGSAYNPNTGVFTAPVRGAYHFEVHAGAIGQPSHGSVAALVKNGGRVCNAYEHQSNGFGTSSNAATLLLESGDTVWVRLWANTVIHDSPNHHSTFTGFLLFLL